MRTLPLLLIVGLIGCESKPESLTAPASPVGKSLGVGDPAPPLKVTQWLQGSPIAIKPGTAYVIEFWATWCGPCKQTMPHLDELSREFGPQGVEFIAMPVHDNAAKVQRYLGEPGHDFKMIHYAWCDDESNVQAWMAAAGLEGIPSSFVIDKNGKIAFIGYPTELDNVLPKVAAGTWRGKTDLEEIAARDAKLDAIFRRVQLAASDASEALPNASEEERNKVSIAAAAKAAPAALEALEAFAKEHPRKAAEDDVRMQTMVLFFYTQRIADAKAQAEAILNHCKTTRDVKTIDEVRHDWLDKVLNPERKEIEIAVQAAEMLLAVLGDTEINAVLGAAEAYGAAGNMAKFEAMAAQARKLTEKDADRRAIVEERLKAFVQK